MSSSALEGGAVSEGERQAAIRIGCGVVQQAAPELFAEGGNLAVLLLSLQLSGVEGPCHAQLVGSDTLSREEAEFLVHLPGAPVACST